MNARTSLCQALGFSQSGHAYDAVAPADGYITSTGNETAIEAPLDAIGQ